MRLYVDDDAIDAHLLALLRQAGHDVQAPVDVSLSGAADAVHLKHAVSQSRVLLSRNYDDFEALHELILECRGHYPGVLLARYDNDPNRDFKPPGIVRAIRNLLAAAIPIADQIHILNHWR